MITDTKAVFTYFEEILEGEPEKVEVLRVLMDINWDEQWIIDFIDYYWYDVDELDSDIAERYDEHRE